jgi:hypothetical protein
MQCLTQYADHYSVLQRDDCLIEHKAFVNLNETDQIDPVLANTVNALKLITGRELSKSSGQLDDAVFSRWACASLVRRTETSGLRQVQVGVSLLQRRHERGRNGSVGLYRE